MRLNALFIPSKYMDKFLQLGLLCLFHYARVYIDKRKRKIKLKEELKTMKIGSISTELIRTPQRRGHSFKLRLQMWLLRLRLLGEIILKFHKQYKVVPPRH